MDRPLNATVFPRSAFEVPITSSRLSAKSRALVAKESEEPQDFLNRMELSVHTITGHIYSVTYMLIQQNKFEWPHPVGYDQGPRRGGKRVTRVGGLPGPLLLLHARSR